MADSTPSPGSRAVFLSYASQDAEAARHICESLRAAGVEVWFDADGGLEHGDEWDTKIRRQIKECVLFIPIISANTQAREEGYFRLEWELAAQRSLSIASGVVFILPVVIDGTREPDALVPDRFRTVQWTRLPGGVVPADTLARFLKLWSHRTGLSRHQATQAAKAAEPRESSGRPGSKARFLLVAAVVVLIAGLGWWLRRARSSGPRPAEVPAAATPAQALSEARQLADRAFALSVDKYDSTLDDYNTADLMMKRALALDPNDGEIWARSAQLNLMFRNRGFDYAPERIATGREQAERAIRMVPDSTEAIYALGFAQRYATNDRKGYLATMQRALQKDPNHARAMLAVGSQLIMNGQTEQGLALFDRARQQPEWAPLADYFLFLDYFNGAQFAEAEHAVRRSISERPSANPYGGLAMLHLTWKGDLDEAARELADVPEGFKGNPRIVWVTAQVQLSRREPDAALRALDHFTDDFIHDSWFSGPKAYLVGQAQALAGRPEAARLSWESGLAVVERKLKEAPSDTDLLLSRGELLALLGRTDEALRTAHTLEQIYADRRLSWFISPVKIYADLGRVDLAVPLLKKLRFAPARYSNWPLTATLLRQDPLWDKLREAPEFQGLLAEPATPAAAAAPVDEKSVAVLAFANLSDDKGNEYFSDGVSEELLNVLAKIPELKVTARTSSFYFKGKQVPIADIARQLGVAYVVEGSVRKQGDKVRITAELIKAADGFHVWSDTFTRDLKDIFAVQDEIAGLIAKNLQLKMGIAPAAEKRAINPEAYQEYLAGRAAVEVGTKEKAMAGIAHFQRALALEPAFTAGWVQLALTYVHLGRYGGVPSGTGWSEAIRAAEKAQALEPDSPDVLLAVGWVRRTAEWNWLGAEQALRRALQLRPNHAETLAALGVLLTNLGRGQESVALAQRAAELDPLNAECQSDLLSIFSENGRYGEAVQAGRRSVQLAPNSQHRHGWLAMALAALRQFPEAETEAALEPEVINRLLAQGITLVKQGRTPEARAKLREMEARAEALQGAENVHISIAYLYAELGESAKAVDAFEQALADRDPSIAWARSNFFFQSLQRDPRWDGILHRIGLADDQLK